MVIRKIEAIQTVAITAIKYAALVGVAFFIYRGAAVLAGRETSLKAVINGLIDMRLTEQAAWLLAGLFGVGYARERRLRKRTIEGMSDHLEDAEKRLDRKRSTSGLTRQGNVPKKVDAKKVDAKKRGK